ncbi:MAG: ribosome small subunit-dependent GTPase A [Vicingaceae bacterium]
MEGVVTKTTGSFYWVKDKTGKLFTCRLKGNIRLTDNKFTNPASVGDVVTFFATEKDEGVIGSIHPRKNYIVRKSVNLSKQAHILASNIDQAILVATLVEPKTYTVFIDRYLVTAEAYHIPAIIVFNKIDLYDKVLSSELKELTDLYTAVGYQCFAVSAMNDSDFSHLTHLFKNKTSLISGYSGVGKSTLINRLDPSLNLKTSVVSESHASGVHTTTFSEMHEMKGIGWVIDTPGIKGLGVLDIKKEELSHYFIEMRELLSNCRFNNCVHIDEPGCAVKAALERGEVAASRYKSYLNIFYNQEDTYR